MADQRQKIFRRFIESPPALEGGLNVRVEPVDDRHAWLRIESQGHRFDAKAAALAVPYPSGLRRLLASEPAIEVVLLEEASRRFDRAAQEERVGFLDLRGRGRLNGPGFVYVVPPFLPPGPSSRGADIRDGDEALQAWAESSDAWSPLRPRPSNARVSPFAAKASRVPRALLSEPGRIWRVSEVADRCRMNPGNAHRVLGALVDRGLLDRDRDGYVIEDPGSLLEAWCEEGRRAPAKERVSIPIREDLRADVSELVNALAGSVAVSGELAAELYAPHLPATQAIVHCLNVDAWDPERLQAAALSPQLRPRGHVVIDLADGGVGDFGEERDGLPLVSPQQLYFDLFRERSRSREAGEHVRRELLQF